MSTRLKIAYFTWNRGTLDRLYYPDADPLITLRPGHTAYLDMAISEHAFYIGRDYRFFFYDFDFESKRQTAAYQAGEWAFGLMPNVLGNLIKLLCAPRSLNGLEWKAEIVKNQHTVELGWKWKNGEWGGIGYDLSNAEKARSDERLAMYRERMGIC